MPVVYFTNNAASGSGSLFEAVKNASPGDVVRPDPAVFDRGATIEIALASQLNVEKNLTLDAESFRVRLDGGGSRLCASVAKQVVATFTAVDFVAGSYPYSGGGVRVETSGAATFNRCRFAGCRANYGGAVYAETGSSLTLNDCVVAGCAGTSGIGGIYAKGGVALNGCVVAGCVAPTGSDVSTSSTATVVLRNSFLGRSNVTVDADSGCVVNVADSEIGYVAPPPDDLTLDDWNANLWSGWDLRLLDDGASAPSPYRNAGNPAFASTFDFDGIFRGRRVDGANACSPGAYETIQADLFWVGGESGAFASADGWASSRFATATGTAAPSSGATLFVGRSVVFSDAAPSSAALLLAGTETTIPSASGDLTLESGAVAQISGALTALKFGDYAELTPTATTALPPISFAGIDAKIAGESFELNGGVAFAPVARPENLAPTNGGGWSDSTVSITSLDADPTDIETVAITYVKTADSSGKNVFLQYSEDDGASWTTVETTADIDDYTITVSRGADVIVRIGNELEWRTAEASTSVFLPVWVILSAFEFVASVSNAFEIAPGGSNDGVASYNFDDYGLL